LKLHFKRIVVMPKKFAGENSKAVAAKARKNEKAASEKAAKDKAAEDALWEEDKSLSKKLAKKEEAERKRLEASAKKKERQELVEQEQAQIISKLQKANPIKVTQAQIREEGARREAAARGKSVTEVETHLNKPLEENVNRMEVEGEEARTVEEAISVLSIGPSKPAVDKHPEKRMKAAYEDFEKERLPQLKAENGNMRLSQLKQMLRKEWQKHPNNPLNVKLAAMAADRL